MTSLLGKRIVNTRAPHQANNFDLMLKMRQAIPIAYPCIDITAPDDTTQLDQCLKDLESFDWLIVTSANTIYALSQRINALDLKPDWSQLQLASVGEKTAKLLRLHFEHVPIYIPDTYTADALAESLPFNNPTRIFIPQSAIADESLATRLRQQGAEVITATAYQTIIGTGGDDVPAMLQAGDIDALTFASSSAVENFLKRIHPLTIPDIPVACIGPSTGKTAQEIGFRRVIVPKSTYTLSAMLDSLTDYFDSLSNQSI